MEKKVLLAGFFCSGLLAVALNCQAANWVKNDFDVPNKNVASNYFNADSIKVNDKKVFWTEKFILTELGERSYTKHLSQYPACRANIEKKGNVTYHQIDFEIKEGKFRLVAKRNYNKNDEVVCTDKDMGNEFDKSWNNIAYGSPMYERHYMFATKYKLKE